MFDPKRLSLRNYPTPLTSGRLPATRPKPREWYFYSRIPGAWLHAACGLSLNALRVALAVWHESTMRRCRTIRVPAKILRRFCISRVDPGLAVLERANLVSVNRKCGRRPIITILEPQSGDEADTDGSGR